MPRISSPVPAVLTHLAIASLALAEGATLRPQFEGSDKTRTQIPVRLVLVTEGLSQPTDMVEIPGEPGTFVVLEKPGRAVTIGTKGAKPRELFSVDVDDAVEQGLLGIALHPRFSDTRRFYLNYNPKSGKRRTRIAEWEWPKGGKPKEARVLLEVEQPYQNHKGGQLAFGPDGFLYIGFGDGGAGGDPHGNGQDLTTMLGSMLRIDVDSKSKEAKLPYGIPKDNPFVGKKSVPPETWAYGLRNPWRFSFSKKGALIVADVGQSTYEEITVLGAGDNAGWNVMEGASCFEPKTSCKKSGLVLPVLTYGRTDGISITGGFEYLGETIASLRGKYVFGDFGSGKIWAIPTPVAQDRPIAAKDMAALGRFGIAVSSFGRGLDGELYVAAFDAGAIYRIVDAKIESGSKTDK